MKSMKRKISLILVFAIVFSVVLMSGVTTAFAAYGSISIGQGIVRGGKTEVLESGISKYYPKTGPLIVKISSIFTDVAADNAEIVITNSSNQAVFRDRGKRYFLNGTYAINKLDNLPVGKYRIRLIWGAVDLGTDGYKDFTVTAGQHPGAGPVVEPSSVKLNKTSMIMEKFTSETLTATVSPANATDRSVTWKSGDTKKATVDSSGKVTAVGNGSTYITATTANGKSARCKVTVKTSAQSVKLNKTSASVAKGKTVQLSVTAYDPVCVYPKAITWVSKDRGIATVDAAGKVKGIKAGSTYIYAKTWNGVYAKCKVTVK